MAATKEEMEATDGGASTPAWVLCVSSTVLQAACGACYYSFGTVYLGIIDEWPEVPTTTRAASERGVQLLELPLSTCSFLCARQRAASKGVQAALQGHE